MSDHARGGRALTVRLPEESSGELLPEESSGRRLLRALNRHQSTPHQARQRWRATAGTHARPARKTIRSRRADWKAKLRESERIPSLLDLLEPEVVWEHAKGIDARTGSLIETSITRTDFVQYFHKAGRPAYGVYEGSYRNLMTAVQHLIDILSEAAAIKANIIEVPPLEIDDEVTPQWESFCPKVSVLPPKPELTDLPPSQLFEAPPFVPSIPFVEPPLLPVPKLLEPWKDKPEPDFKEPDEPDDPDYEPPDEPEVPPPLFPEEPEPLQRSRPQHGADWTGNKPFQQEIPSWQPMQQRRPRSYSLPPAELPEASDVEQGLVLQELPAPQVQAVPKVELLWRQAAPALEKLITCPRCGRELAGADEECGCKPVQRLPGSHSVPKGPLPAPSRCRVCHCLQRCRCQRHTACYRSAAGASATWCNRCADRPDCTERAVGWPCECGVGVARFGLPGQEARWCQQCRGADATPGEWSEMHELCTCGQQPLISLNWAPPFEDPPPDLEEIPLPPQPKLPAEPVAPTVDRHPEPKMIEARRLPEPQWREPILEALPQFVPPLEPQPVGFMRGVAPVLVLDVSGTMSPVMRGIFPTMIEVAASLLDPLGGEMGSGAALFDVIAFSGQAWAWSASFSSRQARLEEDLQAGSQAKLGRQYTGAPPPIPDGDQPADPLESPWFQRQTLTQMMPTEDGLLLDAQEWVLGWPQAKGLTNLLTALDIVRSYKAPPPDSVLVFSDGVLNDPQHTLSEVRRWVDAAVNGGAPFPALHCVGFFPATSDGGAGARLLKELANITGGSYQRYDPKAVNLYASGGELVPYDLTTETAADRTERLWVEQRLREERRANRKAGVLEAMELTMDRVRQAHERERVAPVERVNIMRKESAERRHARQVEEVRAQNDMAREQARLEHMRRCQQVAEHNRLAEEQAKTIHERAMVQWRAECSQITHTWERQTRIATEQRQMQDEMQEKAMRSFLRRQQAAEAKQLAGSLAPGVLSTSPRPGDEEDSFKMRRELSSNQRVAVTAATNSAGGFVSEISQESLATSEASIDPRTAAAVAARAKCDRRNELADRSTVGQWEAQRKAVEAANEDILRRRQQRSVQLQSFRDAVDDAYGNDVVNRLSLIYAKDEAKAMLAVEAHQWERNRAVARIERANLQTRVAHAEEVRQHREAQARYDQELDNYEQTREAMEKAHAAAKEDAKRQHSMMLEEYKAHHEAMCAKQQEAFQERRAKLLAEHGLKIEAHVAMNAERRQEREAERGEHLRVVAENEAILRAARERHSLDCAGELEEHTKVVRRLRDQHEERMRQLAADHQEAHVAQVEKWEADTQLMKAQVEEALAEAQVRFREAAAQARTDYEHRRKGAETAHERALLEAEENNRREAPRAEKAARAQTEMERAIAFFDNIERCGQKMNLGKNLQREPTPALDRVVEMPSLLESLQLAYPEYHLEELPWPGRDTAGEPGAGYWSVTAPQRRVAEVIEPSTFRYSLSVEADRRLSARHRTAIEDAARPELLLEGPEPSDLQLGEREPLVIDEEGSDFGYEGFVTQWEPTEAQTARQSFVPARPFSSGRMPRPPVLLSPSRRTDLTRSSTISSTSGMQQCLDVEFAAGDMQRRRPRPSTAVIHRPHTGQPRQSWEGAMVVASSSSAAISPSAIGSSRVGLPSVAQQVAWSVASPSSKATPTRPMTARGRSARASVAVAAARDWQQTSAGASGLSSWGGSPVAGSSGRARGKGRSSPFLFAGASQLSNGDAPVIGATKWQEFTVQSL